MKVVRSNWMLGIVTVTCSLMLCACGKQPVGATTNIPADAQTVKVIASNWAWKLSKMTFADNQPIDFQISSVSGDHEFTIASTNVMQPVSQGAKPVNVVWTPKSPGTYHIVCTEFCGAGHDGMFVQFTVK